MTLYEAMANRFVIPVIKQHEARGYAKGIEETEAKWRAWNDGRITAAREGREFDEEPPAS